MRRLVIAVLALAALAAVSRAQTLEAPEPPPEAPEGEDYTVETLDTLETGAVELGIAASGRPGSAPTRRRRMSFSGDDVSGAVRDGSDDPLAGGSIDGRARLGTFSVGRLAPRWGRGLLLGAAGDPWQREALDRGAGARYRGRAGDGFMLRRGTGAAPAAGGSGGSFDALYGRFARRRIGGARVHWRRLALGAVSDGGAAHQTSLALAHARGESELALDRGGGWRAETLIERPLGPDTAGASLARDWILSLRMRAGTSSFTSLAEPGRRGPAQALAAGITGEAAGLQIAALAALWRFRPGVPGARAGLAIERPLAHHGALAFGIEEQRGSRRDVEPSATLTTAATRAASLRQGWWGEWRGGEGPVVLGLRHESWGERPWARGIVRVVTSARIEAQGPAGLGLGLTHTVFRARRGESVYLPEVESDRLVLRALSGEGARTRIEARTPLAGGRVRAALHLASVTARESRPQWTLDWTRRAHVRKPAAHR